MIVFKDIGYCMGVLHIGSHGGHLGFMMSSTVKNIEKNLVY